MTAFPLFRRSDRPRALYWPACALILLASAPVDRVISASSGPGADRPEGKHDPQPLDVRVSSSKGSYEALEPIIVTAEARDTPGFQETIVVHHNPYYRFDLRVYDDRGREVPRTSYGQTHASKYSGYKLDRRRTDGVRISDRMAANLVWDMTRPGEYTIEVAVPYGNPRSNDDLKNCRMVRSAPIKVRVEPIRNLNRTGP